MEKTMLAKCILDNRNYILYNILKTQHYNDAMLGAIASQITSLTIVFSTVYLDTDQRKHQSSASLAFVRGIHRRPVNSPHKWPVTRKIFPFDDVIMRACVRVEVGCSSLYKGYSVTTRWKDTGYESYRCSQTNKFCLILPRWVNAWIRKSWNSTIKSWGQWPLGRTLFVMK